jgi:hypothetical protein
MVSQVSRQGTGILGGPAERASSRGPLWFFGRRKQPGWSEGQPRRAVGHVRLARRGEQAMFLGNPDHVFEPQQADLAVLAEACWTG